MIAYDVHMGRFPTKKVCSYIWYPRTAVPRLSSLAAWPGAGAGGMHEWQVDTHAHSCIAASGTCACVPSTHVNVVSRASRGCIHVWTNTRASGRHLHSRMKLHLHKWRTLEWRVLVLTREAPLAWEEGTHACAHSSIHTNEASCVSATTVHSRKWTFTRAHLPISPMAWRLGTPVPENILKYNVSQDNNKRFRLMT